jgi:hypothetical protein
MQRRMRGVEIMTYFLKGANAEYLRIVPITYGIQWEMSL